MEKKSSKERRNEMRSVIEMYTLSCSRMGIDPFVELARSVGTFRVLPIKELAQSVESVRPTLYVCRDGDGIIVEAVFRY